jgi:CheY-like chemotaxis protein
LSLNVSTPQYLNVFFQVPAFVSRLLPQRLSRDPRALLYLGCSRTARPLPRGVTGHEIPVRFAPHPIRSIQFVRSIGMEVSASRDMRVLIADDQRDVGRSLEDLVRACKHEIVGVVGSGFEAIQAYTRLRPDLVLMDYRMPKLNGATACRFILSKDPAARIILVTGWSPSDDTSASGAIAILLKPIDLERLNATLNSVAETLSVPSPAEMPIPGVSFQQDSIDYSQPVPQPSPVVPPSLQMSFHLDAPQNHLQQSGKPLDVERSAFSDSVDSFTPAHSPPASAVGPSTRRRPARRVL